MKFAAILYILAAIFLSASVTHYLTRKIQLERLDEIHTSVLDDVNDDPSDVQAEHLKIVTRYILASQAPCGMSLLLAALGISFLYGAVSSHIDLRRGRIFTRVKKLIEIAVILVLLLLFIGLGTPR